MAFRLTMRVLDQEIRRDLRVVRRSHKVAHVRALNLANRKARTFLVRGAQSALGLKNQKALRKQIRIPRSFQASLRKPSAGGVYGAYVPKSTGVPGEEVIWLNRKPRSGVAVSASFAAKMRSGHSGIFVRVIDNPQSKRVRRGRGRGTSELPIYEQFVNAIRVLHPIAKAAVVHAAPFYESEFDRQMKLQMRKVRNA